MVTCLIKAYNFTILIQAIINNGHSEINLKIRNEYLNNNKKHIKILSKPKSHKYTLLIKASGAWFSQYY